jgi:N-acetylated-alpha-linked acidic dipeptidase
VYEVWKDRQRETATRGNERGGRTPNARIENDVPVGDLGSGSDYSVFIQHLGVPSTDMTSSGSYGVYHSAFDNFAWFKRFGDPTFVYEKEMAQIFGVEALHLASADVLPYDYELYGKEIAAYIDTAQTKAKQELGSNAPDFSQATAAAKRFTDEEPAARQRRSALEPCPDRCRTSSAPGERAAQPSLVPPRHLRAGAVYRLRCRGHSRSQ